MTTTDAVAGVLHIKLYNASYQTCDESFHFPQMHSILTIVTAPFTIYIS